MSSTTLTNNFLEVLEPIAAGIVATHAAEIDRTGAFPREAIEALGKVGLLGLVSSRDVGGLGEGPGAAAQVVERLARSCASTAMVVCMHYAATAVIEAHGPKAVREAIARGEHLGTLAFSEAGSRSHFWAPVSTAKLEGDEYRLDGHKSWATSAGQADSYVWSSKPATGEGASSIWLVDAKAPGLTIPKPYQGLGLRGNHSAPITAENVRVKAEDRLGACGGGFDIMMGIVLPFFQVMNAGCSIGIMEAATAATAAHVSGARFEHLDSSLADLPTIRAYIARMRIKTDMCRALLNDTLAAMASGDPATMLKVLEAKAAAGETATEVTDLAMRVCGGAAYRQEVGVERNFRDARAATVMAPTTDVLYDFIGKAVCGLPLF